MMNNFARDIAAVQRPLAVLVLVAAAGAALVMYTKTMVDNGRRQLRTQESLLRDARTRYQRSGDEKDMIVKYLPAYEQLQKQGLIGTERRIDWLDGLRISNQGAQLYGTDYQIGAQQPYTYAAELNPGKLAVTQSIMKVGLRLVHEGDLPGFLTLLEQQQVGQFNINQCTVQRLESAAAQAVPRAQPNLRAECELAWVTINPEPPAERRS